MAANNRSSSSQPNSQSDSKDDVLFETINGKGVITLNRPKALNALDTSMIRKIYPTLKEWEATQKFIIIKAAGESINILLNDKVILK